MPEKNCPTTIREAYRKSKARNKSGSGGKAPSSIADYVQEITESCTEIPDHLQIYIDYERMGRDMDMSGDIVTMQTRFD